MTLHISYVGADFVLQVGDRLLTTKQGNARKPWDAYANKSIYVEALNGRGVVSYAGLAHVSSEPTDQWLVGVISGESPDEPFLSGGGPPMRARGPVLGLTLGGICRSIVTAIERDFLRQRQRDRHHGIEILITGWTWPHDWGRSSSRRSSTFGRFITHTGDRCTPCKEESLPSWTYNHPRVVVGGLASIGAGSKQQTDEIRERLLGIGRRPTPDEVEVAITEEIRRASTPCSGIGSDLMSIFVPGMAPDIELRYLRDTRRAAPIVAFSPAIVCTGGMIAYPSVATGFDGFSYGSTGPKGPGRTIHLRCIPPVPVTPEKAMFSQAQRRP